MRGIKRRYFQRQPKLKEEYLGLTPEEKQQLLMAVIVALDADFGSVEGEKLEVLESLERRLSIGRRKSPSLLSGGVTSEDIRVVVPGKKT